MFAVTERLLLRPGWTEDAAALTAAIGDREIARNLARVPWPYARADAEDLLYASLDPMRPRFLICLRDSNRIVGGIGLAGDAEPELGYWIARGDWGRGYATEAGRAVMALADSSLRLPRIGAHSASDNERSANVLRKLGFRAIARKAWSSSLGRSPIDTCLYARERDERPQAMAA